MFKKENEFNHANESFIKWIKDLQVLRKANMEVYRATPTPTNKHVPILKSVQSYHSIQPYNYPYIYSNPEMSDITGNE